MDKETGKEFLLYNDIQQRTGGEIYIGVVGPVRTGKSTFIKQFMDLCVLPYIENENVKKRAQDELPQSATGRTIMTTEPKFIPKEAAQIKVGDANLAVRLIDCVGYMVDGATGHIEEETERMVKTPWFDYEIPFTQAAEIGTKKVITDHSTIGIVVTTDGSFGEIARENYQNAEEKTILELKKIGKPFVVLLNSTLPYSEHTIAYAKELQDKYQVTVIPVNCARLRKEDIDGILETILYEFPVEEIQYAVPGWISMLEEESPIKADLLEAAKEILANANSLKDVKEIKKFPEKPTIENIRVLEVDGKCGSVKIEMRIFEKYYYEMLSNMAQTTIRNEYDLVAIIKELSENKKQYTNVGDALSNCMLNGYSVVAPQREKISLNEPEVFKNGQKYGVKIKAKADSIYMIQTSILTEIAPIVGSEQQAKDLIDYITKNANVDENGIWETNIFGKTVEQIVEDGINEKIHNITEENIEKIRDTLQKVMNENTGLVCLIV